MHIHIIKLGEKMDNLLDDLEKILRYTVEKKANTSVKLMDETIEKLIACSKGLRNVNKEFLTESQISEIEHARDVFQELKDKLEEIEEKAKSYSHPLWIRLGYALQLIEKIDSQLDAVLNP